MRGSRENSGGGGAVSLVHPHGYRPALAMLTFYGRLNPKGGDPNHQQNGTTGKGVLALFSSVLSSVS